MKCETTYRGRKCDHEAKYIVSGGVVRRHPTCEMHGLLWLADSFWTTQLEPLPDEEEPCTGN